ncbi:MAG: family 78 glycoside hydrolase catalytic domain [Terriglobia bacterium]
MLRMVRFLTECILVGFMLVCCGLPLSYGQTVGGPGAPTNLRCEYLTDPLGVDSPQPRFSWVLAHSQRGEKQAAYQVLVATEPDGLAHDRGDQWDSGKVPSEEFSQVVYGGKALGSGRNYYWKVRYWDNEGKNSDYSRPGRFGMGLLSREEWKGSWIGGGSANGNEFRKEFTVTGKVTAARVYITALGYYELRINGRKISQNVLDPGWTTYPQRVLYSTYDITSNLRQGANAVAVMLGGGWALQAANLPAYYPSPAFLLQMNAELEGGRQVSVVSDGAWKTILGPVIADGIYDGEVYDGRRETTGWDTPGFADSPWSAAQVVEGSAGIRSSQMMPPIRVVDTLVPVRLTSPSPAVYVFDMGQNMSGWARLRVRGAAGTKVTLRYAEELDTKGMINRDTLGSAKSRDIYFLRGDGVENYEARFTYHGFRYVEVTGFPGTPSLDTLRGRVVHTAVNTVGSFLASKEILNDIQKIIRWSQLTNLFSVPTDCDQRNERQGWLGDAQATAEEAMLNFDMAAFYTNYIRDIADAQRADGALPSTVPRKYGDFPGDLGWETAYISLCWHMWEQYGDRRILEQQEAGLKKYAAFLNSQATGNLIHNRLGHEGDWVELEHTPHDYIQNAWYYHDVETLARIEQVLGNSPDAVSYGQLAQGIREALNRSFFHPDTGEYANGTQAANAMALGLDLVPQDRRNAVADHLTNDILYYHNTHVTTGFIGVKFLMPALTAAGHSDLAYDLAVQTTFPSWGYMVSKGATTLWELWQDKSGPAMNSHDHIMFGSVGAWFYQALAGINQGAGGAGYRHIRIQPHIMEDLDWTSATVETIRGTVTSSWTHFPGAVALHVAIPVGSDARVVIPKLPGMSDIVVEESGRVIWEKDHFISGASGITQAIQENHSIAIDVGSGDYSFRLTSQ